MTAELKVTKPFQLRILDLFSLFCRYWLCVVTLQNAWWLNPIICLGWDGVGWGECTWKTRLCYTSPQDQDSPMHDPSTKCNLSNRLSWLHRFPTWFQVFSSSLMTTMFPTVYETALKFSTYLQIIIIISAQKKFWLFWWFKYGMEVL